jgi:hypothetical protein
MRTFAFALVVGSALVGGLAPEVAVARTLNAAAGMSGNGSNNACFDYGLTGGVASSCTGVNWIIPLAIDNAGGRTVSVVARAASGQSISCVAHSINNVGTVEAASSPQTWSNVGYTTKPLTLSTVGFGSTIDVICTLNGTSSTTRILEVDYPQ